MFVDIGTEINQYQIVEHIGRGGMADVWSARDRRLNRMVAIKTIVHGLSSNIDPVAMFRKEAQTIAQMEHPHILPIYDFGDYKGTLYIVMRYVAGGALSDLMENGPLPPSEVMRLAGAVARALDYAHTNNVVHLDLKPQNILLDSYQSPYLADFGLASVTDPQGRVMNPGSGTLIYMAPEQLTSETIDYRADIYSFGILLYHMFTGELPFKGAMPLAMKQLQYYDELPEIDDLPPYVTQILRHATSASPASRPKRLADIMNELEVVFSDAISSSVPFGFDTHEDLFLPEYISLSGNADLLEAVDIYSRARHAWAGGQGRFLLGVTHFMVMNSYYVQAGRYGLSLDTDGKAMLLRGALEYDRDIDYWWAQLTDGDRRWVCLHAIRSANAPARIRALYRIETLSDSEPPRIARLVAQALQNETDEQARLAELQVLGTRARLLKPHQEYDIKTEYRGHMLTSFTRLEVQVAPEAEWQEAVYSPEIDTLIAQTALDTTSPPVSELAARIIGRIRSKTALRYLAKQQRIGQAGALRALALVRDESDNLPPVVNQLGRWYAWLANTWRRITDRPLELTWRFLFAVLGGWFGLGFQVYTTFREVRVFAPDRIANTIGYGLAFGFFVGITVLLADEIPSRLCGFWRRSSQLAFCLIFGVGWATLSWGLAVWMYTRGDPNWHLMVFGGFGLSLGFILNSMLNLRGWIAVVITTLSVFITIYAPFNNFCQSNYICPQSPGFSVAAAPLFGLVVGVFAGMVLRSGRLSRPRIQVTLSRQQKIRVGLGLGLVWAIATWGINAMVWGYYFGSVQWSIVVGLVIFGIASGAFAAYYMPALPRNAFAISAIGIFIAVLFVLNPSLVTATTETTEQFGFAPDGSVHSLFYYDPNQTMLAEQGIYVYNQLFTSGMVFALFIALGGHLMSLRRDLQRLIVPRAETPVFVPIDPADQSSTLPLPTNNAPSQPVSMMTTIFELQSEEDTPTVETDPNATQPR
jgi:hypothetical protein